MKIDNAYKNFDPAVQASETGSVQKTHGHHRGHKTTAPGTDSVTVSSDAQFATSAISASQSTADVRPDVVARAKQLLADGKIGNDPQRLADRLIDHALDSND